MGVRSRSRSTLVILGLILALAASTSLAVQPARADEPAAPATRTVTLVGSLQSELGCGGDWDPACPATDLIKDATGSTSRRSFAVPAGTYEFKVAIDHAWTESYGPAGNGDNGPLVLAGPAELSFVYDDQTHTTTVTPTDLPGDSVTTVDRRLATNSLRSDLTKDRFYFLMADRFANGNTANDRGGLTGDRLSTGYDPSDKGFYHGGDLKGVLSKLDYIKGMGTTAIWLTPSFKNRPVQGTGADASAGYHGYWITDFTQIDPHLGTNEDMKALIAAAHRKGMKVFFDIITNHTADVITSPQAQPHPYRSKADFPYRAADGTPFDDRDYIGRTFPAMDAATSFPYPPVVSAADQNVKVPAWLNDPLMYHNRGETTYSGENSTYGDFSGLDDLFTERPEVVSGMTDIYRAWVDFGIDGFRIDTVKHVNTEFWSQFSPAVLDYAHRQGSKKFFMFGEVYDSSPSLMSTYTTKGKLQATLDFGFQAAASNFVQGKATSGLRNQYADDDYFTDSDSNAYELPTFLGNHDMGRLSMMLTKAGFTGADRLDRVTLANQLMYLTRGQPVTYYGDEQGLIGAGGDKDAREDMFATSTRQYADEENLYGAAASGAKDRFGTNTALYRSIRRLAELRDRHPTLADGAQVQRYASGDAGIFAVSRIDPRDGIEYIVAANNSTKAAGADFETFSNHMTFKPVYGATSKVESRGDGRVKVTVPALGVSVWQAKARTYGSAQGPKIIARAPGNGADFSGRAQISGALTNDDFAQVSFAYRLAGQSAWTPLGTDDNAPYRVFHDVSGLANGTVVEYRMVSKDLRGRVSATSTSGVVGAKGVSTGPVGGDVGLDTSPQPGAVSIPGSHDSELGCPGDWQPDCTQAQLTRDAKDDVWRGSGPIAPGSYEYKIAYNKSWDTNYGLGGAVNGSNIPFTVPASPAAGTNVKFYYDHRTHHILNSTQGSVIAAVGDFQSELGCPGDWDPTCLRAWLEDRDGDGTYTFTASGLPAGSYQFKVAYDESWDVNYGAGGKAGGDNISFTVQPNTPVLFTYVSSTHVPAVAEPPSATDLTKSKAVWLTPKLLAWPAADIPAGTDPRTLRYRLHAAADAGLTADAERINGDPSTGSGQGDTYNLRLDPRGLPDSVTQQYPQLKGYLALRFDIGDRRLAASLLRGQLAVGVYTDEHKIKNGSGVQIAPILDALYGSAADRSYGVDWGGSRPTFRVWAPTAQSVNLLTWAPDAAADASVEKAQRTPMTRAADGSWSAAPAGTRNGTRYLYELTVYQPSTRRIETNRVTDPYSVALTLNSTRSVAVDMADSRYMPRVWSTTKSPALARGVDSTIYELHVRDFSVSDESVPAEHRGSYLAFADNGNGTKHLRALAKAGMNTVHLLPSFDIASIEEDPAKQQRPDCDLASYAPDSQEQQACVSKIAAGDAFNWGYDPWHWLAPEGSYASSPAKADGGARVAEFRTMVGALHRDGLRVVLDQVFNHTPASGQASTSVLDQVVPGYYQRLDADGAVATSTCCQNVATENTMAQKIMVDATVTWARDYRVDGFRYDLMGHHSVANMEAVRAALDRLTLRKDGVDGKRIYLYGEGWNFGEVANNARFTQATQGQLGGTGIGTFSDRLRDAVRGGGPFEEDPRVQGLGTGLVTDPNASPSAADQAAAAARLRSYSDLAQLGLAGNLRSYTFTNSAGAKVRGDEVDYNGSPAGYADEPDEVISYVDAHDNETLFDELAYKLPVDTSMADRVRMNTVALSFTALAQTPSLWHAGTDLLRSKSLDRNSYNSGDWFNTLDWTGADNGFGHGLPPKADNESKWSYQQPLLANPALKPDQADVATASARAADLLKLRFSTPLFRLGSADLINQKVTFPVSGTTSAQDGVVVMRIDDTVGRDVDRSLAGVLVVINTSPNAVQQQIPGMAGKQLALSPVQRRGSDPVVKTSTWNPATATAGVPARSAVVFVQAR